MTFPHRKHDNRFIFSRAFFLPLLSIAISIGTTASAQSLNTSGSSEENQEQIQGSVPEEIQPPTNDAYKGVVPGKHDVVEHTRVSKIHSKATKELTWIGFQKQDDKDRVFFQFDTVPYYTIKENGNEVIIVFEDTAPTAKNFIREIDTSAFQSRIKKIKSNLDKHKGVTTVTIQYDSNPNYVASTENGYLFIDFPK